MECGRLLKLFAVIVFTFVLLGGFMAAPAKAVLFQDVLKTIIIEDIENDSKEVKADKNEENVITYKIKTGDTLWEIAVEYGLECEEIAEANGIKDASRIKDGQEIKIPVNENPTHVVKRGESLWNIAREFDTDIQTLSDMNHVSDPRRLKEGTVLKLPREEAAVRTNSSSTSRKAVNLWNWPIEGAITSTFGPRGSEFHHGIDIAGNIGSKICPVRGGRVIFSGWMNNIYGRAVIIEHENNIKTVYAHNSKNLVSEGQYVDASTAIAELGNTGRTTGPHLHLEIRENDTPVNPQKYLH